MIPLQFLQISINYAKCSLLLNTLLKDNIKVTQINQDIDINQQHTTNDPRKVSLHKTGVHTNGVLSSPVFSSRLVLAHRRGVR